MIKLLKLWIMNKYEDRINLILIEVETCSVEPTIVDPPIKAHQNIPCE